MSLPISLRNLIIGNVVEDARIEYKTSWDQATSLKTICAFANDIDNFGGGYIVIGVDAPDGHIEALPGLDPEAIDGIEKKIFNSCKRIRPDYSPIVAVEDYEGKKFILIWAPGGSQRPYSSPDFNSANQEYVYWIRKMSLTVRPTESEKRELYDLSNNVPFDDRINHSADVSDLNLNLIKGFLKDVGSDLYPQAESIDFIQLCRQMNLVDGPAEYVKPKNVSLLFFTQNPEDYFPYARIEVVELPDGEGGDQIHEHVFRGPIHQQLRDALQYLSNNVIEETIIKDSQKAEALTYSSYPYAALEEALANAVYHKGYDSREPIEVRILPDRIEILSHPGADRSISIENLKQYRAVSRRYRNRRVGEFLKELHLTEGRNTGIHKIVRSLRQNGSPAPRFETDEERIYFLTTIFKRTEVNPKKPAIVEAAGDSYEPGSSSRVAERQKRVLDYLAQNPHESIAAASEHLSIKRSTLEKDIRELKAQGKLERSGSRRSGSWKVLT